MRPVNDRSIEIAVAALDMEIAVLRLKRLLSPVQNIDAIKEELGCSLELAARIKYAVSLKS